MASEADHLLLANRNHATLAVLLPNAEDHPEWVTTIAFYKAVQIFEAVFAKQNIDASTSHRARAHTIKRKLKNEHLFKQYNALLTASKIARYLSDSESNLSYKKFSDFMPPSSIIERVIKKRLIPIEQQCKALLSSKCSLICIDPAIS